VDGVKYPASWLIGLGVLLMLVMRRHMVVAMLGAVALLAVVELGALGLVMLWPSLMAVVIARRSGAAAGPTAR
jgi:hypothetical protein